MSESKSTDQLKLKAVKNEPSGRTVSRHALDPAHRTSISHYKISDKEWYSSEISINDLVDELESLTEGLSKPYSGTESEYRRFPVTAEKGLLASVLVASGVM